MNLLGLAIRNLGRRPMRTALSILGISLAIGGCIALVSVSNSIEDSMRDSMDEAQADFILTQRGASDFFGGFLSDDLEAKVLKVPGVAKAAAELTLFAPTENDKHLLAAGWRVGGDFWATVPLREGRLPTAGEKSFVVIGDNAAVSLKKNVGDTLEAFGEEFKVIGISKFQSLINRGIVLFGLEDLQDGSYRRGQISMIHVKLKPGMSLAETERTKNAIVALGPITISQSDELLKNDRNLQILKAVSAAVSMIAMVMGAMFVLNTLVMTIQERTREIGIVSAIGWSNRMIMASIIIEGLTMCAVGCVFGVAISFFAALTFHYIPTVGNVITFHPSASLLAMAIVSAFCLCTIGALYPAWRATRMTPAVALQRA